MEEANGAGESPGSAVALLRDQPGYFSQSGHRPQNKDKPGAAANESCRFRSQEPGRSRDQEHREGRKAPGAIQSSPPPGLGQQDQRRGACNEEQDVVQVEHGWGDEWALIGATSNRRVAVNSDP